MNILQCSLILFFVCINTLYGIDFQAISTAKELDSFLENKYDEKTLIAFDVDYVLITPKDIIFRFAGEQDGLRKKLFNHLKNVTSEKYKSFEEKSIPLFDYLMSKLILMSKNEPVDLQMAPLIAKLQNKNIPIIALTQNRSSSLGRIPSQSIKKINDLKEIGIDFSSSKFGVECIVLKNVVSNDGLHPVYERGIIFANGVGKGDALKAFLLSQNYRPEKVIFIDDRKEYLESVNQALKSMGIPYIGLQYIQMAEKGEKVDPLLAQYQFNFLLENGVWLDDAAAEKIVNKHECFLKE